MQSWRTVVVIFLPRFQTLKRSIALICPVLNKLGLYEAFVIIAIVRVTVFICGLFKTLQGV